MSNDLLESKPKTVEKTPPTPESPYQKPWQRLNNPYTLYKIIWGAGTVTALLLLVAILGLLGLYLSMKGTSSLDNLANEIGNAAFFIQYAQFAVNFAIALIIVEGAGLAYFLYRNATLRAFHITYKIVMSIVVQLVYIFAEFSKLNGLAEFIHEMKSGSIGGMLGSAFTGDLSGLDYFTTGNIIFLLICLILLMILSVVLFINIFLHKNILSKIKHDRNALGKKGKIIAVTACSVAGAIVIALIGVYVYSTFIYKNNVNLMNGVSITYESDALSGEATASVSYNWPAAYKNNVEIQNFLDTVQFDLNKSNGIKNGDKIEVQAKVSSDYEKKYRIKITGNLFKSVTVSGLSQYVTDVKQLSSSNLSTLQTNGSNDIKQGFGDDQRGSTVKFVGWYYKPGEQDGQSITMVGVYAVHDVYSSEFYSYSEDMYETYNVDNIILDKDGNLNDNSLSGYTGNYSITTPDDLLTDGLQKASS